MTGKTANAAADVTQIVQKHTFVGVADRDLCLSLIQNGTKLYLVNHAVIALVLVTKDASWAYGAGTNTCISLV